MSPPMASASVVSSFSAVEMAARRTRRRLPTTVSTSVPMTTARMATVRRRRMSLSAQPVADPPHRGEGEAVAELLAKLPDVDVDGALVAVPPFPPDSIEQLASRQRQARVQRQIGEQVELPTREG